jgi:hypothetical protein
MAFYLYKIHTFLWLDSLQLGKVRLTDMYVYNRSLEYENFLRLFPLTNS